MIPTREEAWSLLCEFNESPSLRAHALAVEGVMRHLARKRGGDEELWGIVGILHDLDYERYPEEHCRKSETILRDRGWPEEIIHAVLSHGWGICTEVEPENEMEKCLYAVDELTGLVTATALVRPSRSVLDLKTKSVKKKWKDARFAAGVDRSLIERGAERLGVPLEEPTWGRKRTPSPDLPEGVYRLPLIGYSQTPSCLAYPWRWCCPFLPGP